jgi:hypothetical protein
VDGKPNSSSTVVTIAGAKTENRSAGVDAFRLLVLSESQVVRGEAQLHVMEYQQIWLAPRLTRIWGR